MRHWSSPCCMISRFLLYIILRRQDIVVVINAKICGHQCRGVGRKPVVTPGRQASAIPPPRRTKPMGAAVGGRDTARGRRVCDFFIYL